MRSLSIPRATAHEAGSNRRLERELERYIEERFRAAFPNQVRGVKVERYTEDYNVAVYFAGAEENLPSLAIDLCTELMAELEEGSYLVNIYLEPWTT